MTNTSAQTMLPAIPDDDADFTPDLARKIIARYQDMLRLASTPAVRALEEIRDISKRDRSSARSMDKIYDIAAAALATSEEASTAAGVAFQPRVDPWLMACFGIEIARDILERNHRFLEEAIELVQANGCTVSEAHQLVDYVYGRDQGEIDQEVGGVMVTLAALCLASGVDMHAAAETELARVWTKVEKIRAKHFAKPKFSPLPGTTPPAAQTDGVRESRPLLKNFNEQFVIFRLQAVLAPLMKIQCTYGEGDGTQATSSLFLAEDGRKVTVTVRIE